MKRYLVALTLATLAGSTIASIGGCARTIDPAGPDRAGVVYLAGGWFLPDESMDVLRITDEQTRRHEFDRRSMRLDGVFVVPRRTFEWLFKQATEARRMREEMMDK